MSDPTRVHQNPEPEDDRIRRGVIPVVIGLVLVALIAVGVLAFLLLRPGGLTQVAEQPAGEEGGAEMVSEPTSTPVPADALPNAPSNLDAEEIEIFDVPVSWSDNSDNEHGFNIYRRRVDILGAVLQAGQAGADATGFRDQTTVCGATYQYIVASYNNIGESPAQECWMITMPPCPPISNMRIASGAAYGRNVISGALGETADFYFSIGADGRTTFNSDQPGQLGIVDLGDLGPITLTDANLPASFDWQGSASAVPGHVYVVPVRDEEGTLIVFRIVGAGNPITLEYFLHRNVYEIVAQQCPDLGGREPGGPCVSGDGVCDPSCQPDNAVLLQAVPPEWFDQPDVFLTLMEPGQTMRRITRFFQQQDDDDGPISVLVTYPEGFGPDGMGDPTAVYETPTFTETDLDCDNQPCISGDGVCSPTCGQGPSFQGWNPATTISTAAWNNMLTDRDCGEPCVNGDGVCDPQCTPSSSTTPQGDPGYGCIDTDNDGRADDCFLATEALYAQSGLNYSPDPAHARRLGQTTSIHCECLGETMACSDGSYGQNHPVCSLVSGCTCNADDLLVCNDGSSYPDAPACSGQSDCTCDGGTLICGSFGAPVPNHPACAINPGGDEPITTQSCACDGTAMVCTDGTTYQNHAMCQPGITTLITTTSSGTDSDCGGSCGQDGICQPVCDPFWDPYDDSTQDGQGNDFQGSGPATYAAANIQGNQPGNATDPDCDGPCPPGDPTCTCMPAGPQTHTSSTYNTCLPDCSCEQADLVCRDALGTETWRVEDSQTCGGGGGLPTCQCEGRQLVCRDSAGNVTSSAVSGQCQPSSGVTPVPITPTPNLPSSCTCQGVDWVCTNTAGQEVSRTRDEVTCGCRCSGPNVICGREGVNLVNTGANWGACGCSCQGTNLVCADGYSAPDPSCQPRQCTCNCTQVCTTACVNVCTNSCTGQTCKP